MNVIATFVIDKLRFNFPTLDIRVRVFSAGMTP